MRRVNPDRRIHATETFLAAVTVLVVLGLVAMTVAFLVGAIR